MEPSQRFVSSTKTRTGSSLLKKCALKAEALVVRVDQKDACVVLAAKVALKAKAAVLVAEKVKAVVILMERDAAQLSVLPALLRSKLTREVPVLVPPFFHIHIQPTSSR